jgi:hypothetical protein
MLVDLDLHTRHYITGLGIIVSQDSMPQCRVIIRVSFISNSYHAISWLLVHSIIPKDNKYEQFPPYVVLNLDREPPVRQQKTTTVTMVKTPL